jgi:cobalt-zinc-cadmium efflux system outer membrane protein
VFHFISFWMAALILGGAAAASAADIDNAAQQNQAPLTLPRAVELAMEHNVQLKATGAARGAERARGDASTLAPQHRIGAEFENFAGSGDLNGVDSLESTLSLSSTLELGGKRERRRDVAASRLDVIDAEQHARRLDVAAAVAHRYVDVARSESLVKSGRDNIAIAERIVDAVRARATAARASRAEVARAEIALTRARLDEQAAEGALRSARVALSVLWDQTEPDFGATTGDLYRLPRYEAFALLIARLDQNPDLMVFASQIRLADARGRLAESARRADLAWSAGVRRFEHPADQAFVIGVELPLGSTPRAEPLQREAAAERDRLQFEAQARRLELHATLFTAYQQLDQAHSAVTTLREQSTPLAEEALQLSEDGYRNGRYSLLELTDAQLQLLNVRAQSIAAAADFFGVLIEVRRITGEAVTAAFSGN